MDLPYNIDAEKQVIANMLFSQDVLVDSFARLQEDDFYSEKNRIIFATLKKIFDENKVRVESNSLIDRLSVDGNLDNVVDAAYILEIVDSYNDIANSKYYIDTVADRSILRKLITNASQIVNKWPTESAGDISGYISKIEKETLEITRKRKVGDFIPIELAFDQYKQRVSDIKAGRTQFGGIKTGYEFFDRVLMGFKSGEVHILAARPSVGKSALALNFLIRAAARTPKPCVFFSLEMGIEQVTNRILAAKSNVPIKNIQTANFTRQEEENLNKAIRDIQETKLFIDETPAIKVMDIRSKLNQLKSRYGEIGLVVIDYIGLIKPDAKGKKDTMRSLELGEISAALKAVARDFNCPLIVLSQLNRSIEERSTKTKASKPKLSDLRESGNIEQDADVVMFIHREDYGDSANKANSSENDSNSNNEGDSSDSKVTLIIAKNRNGGLAEIDFLFKKNMGLFVEVDPNRL